MTSALLERTPLLTPPLTGPPPAAVEHPRPRLRRMRYEPEPGTRPGVVRAPVDADPVTDTPVTDTPVTDTPVGLDPDAVRRALHGPLRVAMEVLDGRRPPAHLAPHFGPAAMRYWRVATGQRRFRAPARLLRVLLCLPRPGAAEVSAVCDIDGRVRALAARFEQPTTGGPWRCTALRLG